MSRHVMTWLLTVFVDGKAQHLERAGDVHCVEVVIQAEEHLDLRVGIPVLFDNCTHLDGICDGLYVVWDR